MFANFVTWRTINKLNGQILKTKQTMKFIDLTNISNKTPFDSILQTGCGPNFVLNRLDSFEMMIKEQGVMFWFRFWLRFSLNPPTAILREINDKWPDKISSTTIEIHKHFLEGSSDDAIKYCLEKLIIQLRTPKQVLANFENAKLKVQFTKLLQECVEMSFGAALCEIFHVWLKAAEGKENMNYWTLPQDYTDPDFEAKDMEKFIIGYWKEGLLPLLGIKLVRQIPWLLKWTTECSSAYKTNTEVSSFEEGVDMEQFIYLSPYLVNIAQITESLKKHRDEMRRMIAKADEVPDMAKIWSIAKLASKMEQVQKKVNMLSILLEKFSREKKSEVRNIYDSLTIDKTSCTNKNQLPQVKQCACCMRDIDLCNLFRVCKRCIAESWPERRHYCDDACQMEHWFRKHHSEHVESMRKIASEIYEKNKQSKPTLD